MNKIIKYIILVTIIGYMYAHEVVKDFDINKFMGKWYVISLVPNFVEKGCTNSTDIYKLNDDGTVDITYNAVKGGSSKTIKQRGYVSKSEPARWEIQFLKPVYVPFYRAPFEVIILDSNYEYMAVGYPDNTFGWIMARSNTLDEDIYQRIIEELESDFGYDKNIFEKVVHDK